MKGAITVAAVVLLLGFAQEVVAQKPENALVALEKKLHGAWKGESPCLGDLTLPADGTFESALQTRGQHLRGHLGSAVGRLAAYAGHELQDLGLPKGRRHQGRDEAEQTDDKALVTESSGYSWEYSRVKK